MKSTAKNIQTYIKIFQADTFLCYYSQTFKEIKALDSHIDDSKTNYTYAFTNVNGTRYIIFLSYTFKQLFFAS